MAPEIVLQNLFARTIIELKRQPEVLRHLMRDFTMEAQQDAIDYMLKEHFRVVTQYPRTNPTFPMVWIALQSETEAHRFLEDYMGEEPICDETYDTSTLGGPTGTGTVNGIQGLGPKITEGAVTESTPDRDVVLIDQNLDNTYVGNSIILTGGTGAGQRRTIHKVISDIIEVSEDWEIPPDETSNYEIRDTESVNQDGVGEPPKLHQEGSVVVTRGAGYRHNFVVQTLTSGQAHAVVLLYNILKFAVYSNKPFLHKNGIQEIILSGTDLAVHRELLPDHVFSRSLSISCVSYFTIPEVISIPSDLKFDLNVTLCATGQDPIELVSLY